MRQGIAWVLNKHIHWKRLGDESAPTLVLLHGLGRTMNQWNDVAEPLSEHFDVFMFDMPGYGGSDNIGLENINMTFPVWLMDELFKKFGISQPVLLGESFGGLLALEYTLKKQGNVRGLALMDSAGLGRAITLKYRLCALPVIGEMLILENEKHPDRDGMPINFVTVTRMLANLIRFLFNGVIFGRDIEMPRELATNLKLLRYGVGFFGQKPSIRRVKKLKKIFIPVLILHGMEDDIFPVSQALNAYNSLENTWGDGPVIFQKGGHFPINVKRYKDKALGRDNLNKFLRVVRDFGLSRT